MEKSLERHRAGVVDKPKREKPARVEDLKSARTMRGNGCIHCHQVNEFRRADSKAAGTWTREDLWVYPLPENVGITLEVDRGDIVKTVGADSAAAKAGLKAGDVLAKLNSYPVGSFADAQYALNKG